MDEREAIRQLERWRGVILGLGLVGVAAALGSGATSPRLLGAVAVSAGFLAVVVIFWKLTLRREIVFQDDLPSDSEILGIAKSRVATARLERTLSDGITLVTTPDEVFDIRIRRLAKPNPRLSVVALPAVRGELSSALLRGRARAWSAITQALEQEASRRAHASQSAVERD